MIVPRDLIDKIKIFLKRRQYLAIVGPRQCGKTTFLEIIKKYLIHKLEVKSSQIIQISFEDRRLLRQFEDDPLAFIKSFTAFDKNIKFLMIDEFQYARDGGQKLKLVYDTVKNLKIIITGSSSLDLKAKVGRFLVGRLLTFNLTPFNFHEFLSAKDKRLESVYQEKHIKIIKWFLEGKKFKQRQGPDIFTQEILRYLEEFCLWGGYPEVVLSKMTIEKQKILNSIYNNYILKDIKGLLELATEDNLLRLSQYLATQIGNILVYQNLSQVSGLDFRLMKKHLNILKETYIIKLLSPFFTNKQKELSKNPKVFFVDLGFRNSLMENMADLNKRPDSGNIIENVVFLKLKELFSDLGTINFWRTKVGAEVDFVIRYQGGIIPIEVKFSEFNQPKISRSLASFIKTFNPQKGIVLTKNFWGWRKIQNTQFLFAPIFYMV